MEKVIKNILMAIIVAAITLLGITLAVSVIDTIKELGITWGHTIGFLVGSFSMYTIIDVINIVTDKIKRKNENVERDRFGNIIR